MGPSDIRSPGRSCALHVRWAGALGLQVPESGGTLMFPKRMACDSQVAMVERLCDLGDHSGLLGGGCV